MEKTYSRRVCPGCKEELALTAYYRHQHGNNCPGKQLECQQFHCTTNSSAENSFDEESGTAMEGGLDSRPSSLYGCSKCLKQFITSSFGNKPDYSGFDTRHPRNLATHRTKAFAAKEAPTASAQSQIEQSYGVGYSVLLNLQYFDVIRHHVVDPMHALFLGIAKHTIKT